MDRGTWWATVHEIAESWIRLSMHARMIQIPWLPCGGWFIIRPITFSEALHDTAAGKSQCV